MGMESDRSSFMVVVDSCNLMDNLVMVMVDMVALISSLMVVARSRNFMVMVVVTIMVNPVVVLTFRTSLVVVKSYSITSMVVVMMDAAEGKVTSLLGVATPAEVALGPTSAVGVVSRDVAEAEGLAASLCVFAVAKLVI